MNLIINVSNNLSGGGLQVAMSVLEELKKFSEHQYYIFAGVNISKHITADSFPSNFVFFYIQTIKWYKLSRELTPLEKDIKPDCVLTVFGPSYWGPKAPHITGFAIPHYIYKNYLRNLPVSYRFIIFLKSIIHLWLLKTESDCFIVETPDAAERLKKIIKKDVFVVSNTYSSYFINYKNYPPKLPVRKKNEIRLITITRYYLHKNLETIPKVLEELYKRNVENIYFVLTLEQNYYEKLIPEKWRGKVYNTGFVKAEECPSLYNECDIMYLPTLLEVFSASYPEAMIMGKPILTSDLSFAHSICDNAALYFDPFNISDITDKIITITSNKEIYNEYVLRGKERAKIFPSANERAKEYLSLCEKLVSCKNDIV